MKVEIPKLKAKYFFEVRTVIFLKRTLKTTNSSVIGLSEDFTSLFWIKTVR